MSDKVYEEWRTMPRTNMGASGIEIVRARMGPCGLKSHFHDCWSLGLIIEGACRFNSGGEMHKIVQGGLFVIPPYEVHECAAAADNVRYQVIYITTRLLAALAPNLKQFFSASKKRVVALPASLFQQLSHIDGREVEHAQLKAPFQALDLLFFQPAEHLPFPSENIHQLQYLFHQNWKEAFDLKTMTETAGCSRWHAIRTFRQHTGLSPRAYLRQLRALKARHLLEQGKKPAEVAQALHFSDQAHFSRVFKSVFGVPPGILQRLMHKD